VVSPRKEGKKESTERGKKLRPPGITKRETSKGREKKKGYSAKVSEHTFCPRETNEIGQKLQNAQPRISFGVATQR